MKLVHFFVVAALTSLLALQVGCEPTRTKEGTAEYVDDSVITAKVRAALVAEPDLKSTEINVETVKGTVTLSGVVRSKENMEKAVKVTRGVKGVHRINNDMRVQAS